MIRRNQLGKAFVVIAVLLFTVPVLFPIQAVLTHDTGAITFDSREQIEANGIEIIGYEELSERGQELYVKTLENGGEYRVPMGQGSDDFGYLTSAERAQAQEENQGGRPGTVVIERPSDADLPPADEPFNQDTSRRDARDEQHRQQVQQYDMIDTSTGPPSLGSLPQLLRLAAALLAVLSLGIGGYLISSRKT